MFVPDFNSRFYRLYAITTDAAGIDPLRDKMVAQIAAITSYSIHNVVQAEAGAPDLIAYNEYGDEKFWWHIMVYNGLCMYTDVVSGLTLKIPPLSDLIAITTDSITPQTASEVTI